MKKIRTKLQLNSFKTIEKHVVEAANIESAIFCTTRALKY